MVVRFLVVFLLMAGMGFSQSFTGFIDGYYGGNFNKPPSRTNGFRAFDINHNEFSLNYAELAVEQKPAPVGFRVDIGFGDAASVVHALEPSPVAFYQHLQQAYLSASHGKLTFDFGKYVTQHGAEVIETKDNWNYSRSLLFTWAIPFYHFGARATLAANDKVTLGANVSNGWNNVKDNNGAKTVGLMAALKPTGKLTWTTNYMFGDEGTGNVRHLWDSTAILDIRPEVSLMANYDYGMDRVGGGRVRWQGIAGYARFTPVEKVKLTPRIEWFDDPQGFMTLTAQELKEFTFTSQFVAHPNLSLYAEYRHDWSNKSIFESDSSPKDTQDTITFGLVYTFSKGTP